MFNDMLNERKVKSGSCSNGLQCTYTRRKTINNILISYWNYKRIPILMVTVSNYT